MWRTRIFEKRSALSYSRRGREFTTLISYLAPPPLSSAELSRRPPEFARCALLRGLAAHLPTAKGGDRVADRGHYAAARARKCGTIRRRGRGGDERDGGGSDSDGDGGSGGGDGSGGVGDGELACFWAPAWRLGGALRSKSGKQCGPMSVSPASLAPDACSCLSYATTRSLSGSCGATQSNDMPSY